MYSLSLLSIMGQRGCVKVGCCNNEVCLHQLLWRIYRRTLPMVSSTLLLDCKPDTGKLQLPVAPPQWCNTGILVRQHIILTAEFERQQHPFLPLPPSSCTLSTSWHYFDFLCSLKVWVGNHQRSGAKMHSFTNIFFVIVNWIVWSQWVFNLLSCPRGRRMSGKEKVF